MTEIQARQCNVTSLRSHLNDILQENFSCYDGEEKEERRDMVLSQLSFLGKKEEKLAHLRMCEFAKEGYAPSRIPTREEINFWWDLRKGQRK